MPLQIRQVHTRRDLRSFIRLPWRLYSDAPNWVPPLLFDRRAFLDRSKNPFFEHGRAEYFIAERDGVPVGRITAQVDDRFQEFGSNRWGFFGFFECEDDDETARALLETAEGWLRAEGCDRMVGPCDFTTNDECGFLVTGHDRLPVILTNWTHPYYLGLMERAGMAKAMDTYMYDLHIEDREKVSPLVWQGAERVDEDPTITVRPMRKKDIAAEVDRFIDVYNSAWERNWGFVPLTDNEVRHYAKMLKPLYDENWGYVAEKDGEAIAAALTLKDYNQVFKRMNGRFLPFGWAKFLWYRRKIDRVRVFALGVKQEHVSTGVAAKLYERHYDASVRTGIGWGETGWILETNRPMNRSMERMGGEIVRTYRLYEREL